MNDAVVKDDHLVEDGHLVEDDGSLAAPVGFTGLIYVVVALKKGKRKTSPPSFTH